LHVQGKVTVHALDLSDFDSIKTFADTVTTVNVLICNAGIVGAQLAHTKQGFEQNIGVNHFGHFYLTQLLLPKLKASGTVKTPSRVVVVGSSNYLAGSIELEDLHYEKRKFFSIKAYSDAKLANMLFARQLAHKMKAENAPVSVVSLHPGLVKNTGLARNLGILGYISRFQARLMGKSIPQGAATSVYCAIANDVPSGSYWEDCTQVEPKPNALDDEMARKLWEKTEELIASKI
jgi:NAD(P)-dependent dehydrogenase (short-subunit alcohol dehydrogenase family)